jgi:hypothetical protein
MITVSDKTLEKKANAIGLELIKETIANTSSMREAALKLNVPFNSFKRIAVYLNLYKPNQTLSGVTDLVRRGNPGRPKKKNSTNLLDLL